MPDRMLNLFLRHPEADAVEQRLSGQLLFFLDAHRVLSGIAGATIEAGGVGASPLIPGMDIVSEGTCVRLARNLDDQLAPIGIGAG